MLYYIWTSYYASQSQGEASEIPTPAKPASSRGTGLGCSRCGVQGLEKRVTNSKLIYLGPHPDVGLVRNNAIINGLVVNDRSVQLITL